MNTRGEKFVLGCSQISASSSFQTSSSCTQGSSVSHCCERFAVPRHLGGKDCVRLLHLCSRHSFSRRSAHSSSPPPAPPRPTRPCRPSTPWTCHLQVRILCLCDQYNIVKPCLLQKPIVCDSTVKNKMWQLRSSSRFTELSFNVLLTGDTFLKTRWVEPTPQ